MDIKDLTTPGTYVVRTLGTHFTLEVSRGREGELWGEITCFRTRIVETDDLFREQKELLITGPDDRYTFKPLANFKGEVVHVLGELS